MQSNQVRKSVWSSTPGIWSNKRQQDALKKVLKKKRGYEKNGSQNNFIFTPNRKANTPTYSSVSSEEKSRDAKHPTCL